ncbi:MAG: helix-turn-helix domain-containing protein [Acidimicrobiales bacterium]
MSAIGGLGERIKQLRAEQRRSQGDLAEKIGADPGQISRYENSHIAPSTNAIVRLAEGRDVSRDFLLVDDAPRRRFRSAEDALGEHLATLAELAVDDLELGHPLHRGPRHQNPSPRPRRHQLRRELTRPAGTAWTRR